VAQPYPEALSALLDKQAVTETLLGYCRAVDRRDADLMRKVYWPDAVDDHAFLEGVVTAHTISNIWVDLTGPSEAFSECYFQAFHDFPSPEGPRLERTVGGRYLDRHEKRGEEWRIIARTLAIDWYHERPANSVWDSGRYTGLENRGAPKPHDPLYRLHPRGTNA